MILNETKPHENNSSEEANLSVCGVMNDSANEVIRKMEGLMPKYIERFTNLQTEYLQFARALFGTCYIVEKELLDKIGVNHNVIEGFDKCLKFLTMSTISEIEMTNNMQMTFVDNMIESMKTFDEYFKVMLSGYSKMLDYMNSIIPLEPCR